MGSSDIVQKHPLYERVAHIVHEHPIYDRIFKVDFILVLHIFFSFVSFLLYFLPQRFIVEAPGFFVNYFDLSQA